MVLFSNSAVGNQMFGKNRKSIDLPFLSFQILFIHFYQIVWPAYYF